MTLDEVTVVIVPGLRDHVALHWQTLLQAQLPRAVSVPPLTQHKLSRQARVDALQQVIEPIPGPVVLVAHSAGNAIVAHWARTQRRAIHAALLATPADLENPLPAGYPSLSEIESNGWLPLPRVRLPFLSWLGFSRNDPLGSPQRLQALAADWGSRAVDLGEVGHLNPAAGFGHWPQALPLLQQLLEAVAAAPGVPGAGRGSAP